MKKKELIKHLRHVRYEKNWDECLSDAESSKLETSIEILEEGESLTQADVDALQEILDITTGKQIGQIEP